MAVAAQWEGTQPTTRGLASATPLPSSLRADQALPAYTKAQAVAAWWEHAHDAAKVGTGIVAGHPPTAPTSGELEIGETNRSRFESGPQPTYYYAALAALDALYHPIDLVAPAPAPTAGVAYAAQASESLTEADMRAILTATGWPVELHDQALTIAWCESRYRPGAVGDGGNSLGLWQIWYGWFAPAGYSVEQAYDPVTNSRVALYVRTTRGRWGGGGGWSCAGLNGIE